MMIVQMQLTYQYGIVVTVFAGNMAGATPSAVPLGGTCAGPLAYDVWYKFTAVNTTATITISSLGANFLATRGVEIFSGTCGSLTSIACGVTSANGCQV